MSKTIGNAFVILSRSKSAYYSAKKAAYESWKATSEIRLASLEFDGMHERSTRHGIVSQLHRAYLEIEERLISSTAKPKAEFPGLDFFRIPTPEDDAIRGTAVIARASDGETKGRLFMAHSPKGHDHLTFLDARAENPADEGLMAARLFTILYDIAADPEKLAMLQRQVFFSCIGRYDSHLAAMATQQRLDELFYEQRVTKEERIMSLKTDVPSSSLYDLARILIGEINMEKPSTVVSGAKRVRIVDREDYNAIMGKA